MRAAVICSVIFLSPLSAEAAQPNSTPENKAENRARAIEALKKKLAEAEKLQSEIERLRQFAAAPGPETQLRVRIIEVSLDDAGSMGFPLPLPRGDAVKIERLALLAKHSLGKLVEDERVSVVEDVESCVRAGAEFSAETLAKVNADPTRFAFRGIELSITPKSQGDGRVRLDLVCKQFRPILYSDLGPQLRIDEISTTMKLALGDVVVLEGAKQERVASEVRGFSKSGLEIGKRTQTVHRIQTLVVVSREPLVAAAETTDR